MDTNKKLLETAVLFITYNRLDTTEKVFKAIKKSKPQRLYISSNIGKNEGDTKKVLEVRNFLEKNIDWNCEVYKLYRDEHLGARLSISGAIDWFFENEEMGIILEDDVVPTQSFFWFCEKMLNKYKHDERIMMIGGTNYYIDIREEILSDYFFSKQFSIWGWATWRQSWEKYDVNMDTWKKEIQPNDLYFFDNSRKVVNYWIHNFDHVYNKRIDTWDIQWVYACMINNGLTIIPSINMISNIGIEGVHATGSATDSHFLKTIEFSNIENLKNPIGMFPELSYDTKLHKEKTIPAYNLIIFFNLLKKIKIYNILRRLKNIIKNA